MTYTRRSVLAGLGLSGLGSAMSFLVKQATASSLMTLSAATDSGTCPFRLAVINDEITQDFEKACQIVAGDFGLRWIELRSMWDKNVTVLTESETRDQFRADFDAKAQDKLLEHCISLAKSFNTDRIRCFDFWRLDDQKPYRLAINAKLQQAADRCAKDNLILLLENEMSCNTATGEESSALLKAIPNKNFMLNWDPGNAAALVGTPYAAGYHLLPKDRIGHCHCKDVVTKPDDKYDWAPVGSGMVDWPGQLRDLQRDGFHYGLSLETHWRGAGTPEASTRVSMDGLRKTLTKAGISCRVEPGASAGTDWESKRRNDGYAT